MLWHTKVSSCSAESSSSSHDLHFVTEREISFLHVCDWLSGRTRIRTRGRQEGWWAGSARPGWCHWWGKRGDVTDTSTEMSLTRSQLSQSETEKNVNTSCCCDNDAVILYKSFPLRTRKPKYRSFKNNEAKNNPQRSNNWNVPHISLLNVTNIMRPNRPRGWK